MVKVRSPASQMFEQDQKQTLTLRCLANKAQCRDVAGICKGTRPALDNVSQTPRIPPVQLGKVGEIERLVAQAAAAENL
jgi:hypothetical protein